MPDLDPAPVEDGATSRTVDRSTLLLGAAGTLAAAGLSGPARAAGDATSAAAQSGPRFEPGLALSSSRRCWTPSVIRARTPQERFCT